MKSLTASFFHYFSFMALAGLAVIMLDACQAPQPKQTTSPGKITEAEVIAAQKAWANSLVSISLAYQNKADYEDLAKNHVEKFYGYDMGKVLFKPTTATEKPFRPTADGALSYYIGGNTSYPEDQGFALHPWKDVRWENAGIMNGYNSDLAIAMGNYYFLGQDGSSLKAEFTFCYKKNELGELKIVAHKSTFPFGIESGG